MKPFKETDTLEAELTNAILPILNVLGTDLDAFYDGAFESFFLGDVLYDLGRDPMAGVITRGVFRTSFFAIHELFTAPGTFEFYLTVLRAIFGDSVDVEFVIPGPGQLEINVDSLETGEFNLLAREVVGGVYEYYGLKTTDTDELIMGQGTTGIKTQKEMDALINEISIDGIYTVCNLTV